MTPSDREAAGQRIARARRRRGLSQAVLAGLIGRSESWLSQVERGKRGVDSHSVLVRLTEVLRVDLEELTSPKNSQASETRSRAESLKKPPPTSLLCGLWFLKKNGSPGARTRNSRAPLGCQKLTSVTSGRPARNRYQLLSVTPTYARTPVIVHRRPIRALGIPPSPRNLPTVDA
jgi:transcriptional regulator with XRE-family HTH domain